MSCWEGARRRSLCWRRAQGMQKQVHGGTQPRPASGGALQGEWGLEIGARWPAGQRLAPCTCGWWGRALGMGLTEGWVLLCLGYVCYRCFLLVVWGWYREAACKQPRAGLYLDAISRKGVPGAGRTQPGRSHPWVQISHLPSPAAWPGQSDPADSLPKPSALSMVFSSAFFEHLQY